MVILRIDTELRCKFDADLMQIILDTNQTVTVTCFFFARIHSPVRFIIAYRFEIDIIRQSLCHG